MNTRLVKPGLTKVLLLAIALASTTSGQTLQLISSRDPLQPSPAGAGGDSWAPILSPDGRYVLFASMANNLLLTSNGAAIPLPIPPSLNVYLRDRLYGTNALVSVNQSGVAGGNGDSLPAGLSPDGRYVVFESSASDLVAGDTNNASDIFVRDLVGGTTILVSAATNGLPGNGGSRSPAITPDGHYVAFVSAASNLVPGDTNRIADVFVRDLQAQTTVLASVGAVSTSQTGSSEAPDITADGRYVAFYSSASNLVAGVRVGSDIYIRDLVGNTTILASTYARTAVPSNSVACFNHLFSADGHFLAYEASGSTALFGTVLRYSLDTGLTDLVGTNANVPRSAFEDIRSLDISSNGQFIAYVANFNTTDGTTTCIKRWDGQTGKDTIASTNLAGSVPLGTVCDYPSLDAGGQYVAFLSSSTNMVTNAVLGDFHLYFRDIQGATTALLDADTNAVGSNISPATAPRITPDARFAAFDCTDANLVSNDRNRDSDAFLRDLQTSAIEFISAHDPALPTVTPNGPCTITLNSISGDGRYVAFSSEADNLVANDTNAFSDIFVRDLATGNVGLGSADTNGLPGDGVSSQPAISSDGRFIAFTSSADNLAPGDTNRNQDVFLRDMQAGTTSLVSVNTSGFGSGNNASYSPSVSSGARFVLFHSKASNLAPGSFISENLLLRDLQSGVTRPLTTSGTAVTVPACLTPDGRFAAGTAYGPTGPAGLLLSVLVWNSQSALVLYSNSLGNASVYGIALSSDGSKLFYSFRSQTSTNYLYAADLTGLTNWIVDSALGTNWASLRASTDGHWLAAVQFPLKQVFLYDVVAGTKTLVSGGYAPGLPSTAISDSPDISPDGRFVAFRSSETNIVPGDINGQPDIFLYDRLLGVNTLLCAAPPGNSSPDNRSLTPVFSGDGSTLLFESWASNLVPNDFNHSSDIFASTFLTAVLLPSSSPGQGPWISWPWVSGKNYRVQYKNALGDAAWQDLTGSVTNIGVKAFLQDPSPAAGQRFYRVISF